MANHDSAIKRHRQSLKRQQRNRHEESKMKTAVKGLRALIAAKKGKEAMEKFNGIAGLIAATASKGVIKKQAAARTISRLRLQINRLS